MGQITNQMEWLLDVYEKDKPIAVPNNVEKIKLSKLISKLGFFYEKLRNAIDYNEEHLIRRNSLERFLRRQILFLQEKRPDKISKTLIYEFIRARYLPNDTLPETIINELARTIRKYLVIVNYVGGHQLPKSGKLIDWLIALASSEIDEQLFPKTKELALANLMYSQMKSDITFTKIKLDDKERDLQLYVAVLRTLMKADQNDLYWRMINLYLPNWKQATDDDVRSFVKNILTVKAKIDRHIHHPISFQLLRVLRPQSVFFVVLQEVLKNNGDFRKEVLAKPDLLEEKVEEVCLANYHHIRGKLVGSIVRVIIYILFTKTILAFIFELPYDYFIAKEINWGALGINVGFHPFLMFLVAITIRVPGIKNTQLIVAEIKKIVYGEERKIVFRPKRLMRRGSASYLIFNFVYLVMFAVSFGIVVSALRWLHFNILSGILFVFFLTVVSFFGFRLRNYANQLSVIPRKDNMANLVIDFLSLPIIRVGRFLSTNFSKVNIFLFILDFLIETPFKMLVEFLDKTTSFIKDKRDEIVE